MNRVLIAALSTLAAFACAGHDDADLADELPIEDTPVQVTQALATANVEITIQAIIPFDVGETIDAGACAAFAMTVSNINPIFAPAGISFTMDPSRDCKTVTNNVLNASSPDTMDAQAARSVVARRYPGKLVVFIRQGPGGFTSEAQDFVILYRSPSPFKTAHEIGHYLGLDHITPVKVEGVTDGGGGDGMTYSQTVLAIRNAVSGGLVNTGEDAIGLILDGDRESSGVDDTPTDLGAAAYVGRPEEPNWCTVALDIHIPDMDPPLIHYHHTPPRDNVMSYWDVCALPPKFTKGQAAYMRKTLFTGNRQRLLQQSHQRPEAWGAYYWSPAAMTQTDSRIAFYATSWTGKPYAREWNAAWGYSTEWYWLGIVSGTGVGIFEPFTMYRWSGAIDIFSTFMDGTQHSKVFSNATGAYTPNDGTWTSDTYAPMAESGLVAAARSTGDIMSAERDVLGAVQARTYAGAWTNLGGNGDTRPTIVAPNSTSYDLYARFADGGVRRRLWTTADGWDSEWQNLGGSGAGSVAVAMGTGPTTYVYALFPNGTIRTKVRTDINSPNTWLPSNSTWDDLGGQAASPPAAVSLDGTDRVLIARWIDGSVRYRRYVAGAWQTWQSLGGQTVGAPTIVRRTNNEAVVFARFADGTIRSRVLTTSGASTTLWPTVSWNSLAEPPGDPVPQARHAACPTYNPSGFFATFCTDDCPCAFGQGGCDVGGNDCAPGLTCVANSGASVGLPSTAEVCLANKSAYDSEVWNNDFCIAAPCDQGQGDCDNDNECAPGLSCIHDRPNEDGQPTTRDYCDFADPCSGSTVVGDTNWQTYSSNGIYVDVDTSTCNFSRTPAYFTSLGGKSAHRDALGATSIYAPTATGFRIYVNDSGITPALANSSKWVVHWQGVPAGLRTAERCVGTTTGATAWVQYSADGIYTDVSTADCGYTSTPKYLTSLGGNSGHWLTTGATSVYSATATGFRIYVFKNGGLTVDYATTQKWHINWQAQPSAANPCTGATPAGATAWTQHATNVITTAVYPTPTCPLAYRPRYLTALGGSSAHGYGVGVSSIYDATATSFRVYVEKPGITVADANTRNWHVVWAAAR